MSVSDRDPLSFEERELAAHLRRLGAPDGPSAALDARILAAARAASTLASASAPPARARRPRHAAWLPGGAITAVGTAAALVLAVGTAWQLRPLDRPAAPAPATGDDGVVAVELLAPRKRTARPGEATDPPAGDGPAPARAMAAAPRAPTAEATADRHAIAADAAAAAAAASAASGPAAATAPEPVPAEAPASATTPPTPAATAATVDAVAPAADIAAPADANRRPRRATYTTAARARAEVVARPRPPAAPARSEPPDLARVPVHEDAALSPVDWLERIRARRDAGDVEAARASLQRFVRAHPRVRPPPDLHEFAP